MDDKNVYIIAGCNGAGKTTASYTLLPEIIECKEFVNADEIAKGLSPFQPEKVAFESGRIMIDRINDLLNEGESFGFETTLASKTYRSKILKAKKQGYTVTLLFFWLNNIELAKERVRTRVLEGGHYIPDDVIARRYQRGINNLFDIYLELVDATFIFDNSYGEHQLIARKIDQDDILIFDDDIYKQLKKIHDKT